MNIKSELITQNDLAKHLYSLGVEGIERYLTILAEETQKDIDAQAAERERLHGLLEEAQYWIEQVNFVDNGALKARIRAALQGEGEGTPECDHVWLHNAKQGWKVCYKCDERRNDGWWDAVSDNGNTTNRPD